VADAYNATTQFRAQRVRLDLPCAAARIQQHVIGVRLRAQTALFRQHRLARAGII
jgi:hypothetical protein